MKQRDCFIVEGPVARGGDQVRRDDSVGAIANATEAIPPEAAFGGKRLKRLMCATSSPFHVARAEEDGVPLLDAGDAVAFAAGAFDGAGARVRLASGRSFCLLRLRPLLDQTRRLRPRQFLPMWHWAAILPASALRAEPPQLSRSS
jgi:hypothetical protein